MNILEDHRYKDWDFDYHEESWRVIADFQNYRISSLGRVMSVERVAKTNAAKNSRAELQTRIMTPFVDDKARLCVYLTNEKTAKNVEIKKLVAAHFCLKLFDSHTYIHQHDLDLGNVAADNLTLIAKDEVFSYWFASRFKSQLIDQDFSEKEINRLKQQRRRELREKKRNFIRALRDRKQLTEREMIELMFLYYQQRIDALSISQQLRKDEDFTRKIIEQISEGINPLLLTVSH